MRMQTLPTELLMKVFRAKWEPAGEAQPSAVELTLLVAQARVKISSKHKANVRFFQPVCSR